MQCARCKRENPDDASFCMGCGRPLALRCSACQADLPGDANFCPKCGHPASGVALTRPESSATRSAETPASFSGDRYRVVRKLGEGANKRVYLAHDTLLDREVAVGAIKTEGLDEGGVARVRQEARAMGRLGEHPHIVAVHDVSQDSADLYLILQYMSGGDLQNRLTRAENHRLELEDALQIAEEVCAGLDHAHNRGVIHRDIKPGNVWFDGEGRARVGDFGLARTVDRTRITQQGTMVGTAAYMAPEQAMGGTATARSDLYSLGATLYEMLTGRPPFVGDDAVAVISQHINTPPVKPSWHNASVPRPVDDLVLKLLAKDPEERPDDAAGVEAELKRIRLAPLAADPVEKEPTEDAARTSDPFIGRQAEQAQLRTTFDKVVSGDGRTLMVVGEPGVGKTRLTSEFTTFARLRGAQVLVGHCYEGGVSVPYLGFVEAFRQYVRARPDDALRNELGAGAPEVATLVSEVRRRFPDLPESPPLEGEAERLRLFESVASFVRNAAGAQPLVILLDDLHWADKPTLLLFQHLARCIRSERVMLLGIYRDVELERTHPLSEVVAALRREQLYDRVLLRGLSFEDIRDLMRARGGQDPAEGFVRRLLEETEGNPFFIDEVLRHLIEIGALRREGGQWIGDPAVIEQNIPEGVREVIGRRLSRLDARTNEVLTIGAVMPDGFPWDVLTRVSSASEDELIESLDTALRARLIAERKDDRGGVYEFHHALIRQTLYNELSTPRRVRLHRQIGEALEALHGGNDTQFLGALAYHFFQALQSGDAEKAVSYSQRAAERALELLAFEESAAHVDRALQALEFSGSSDEALRCELLLKLGEAHQKAGDAESSHAAYRDAAGLAKELGLAHSLARAAFGFAGPWGTVGQLDPERVALFEAAREALGDEESALRARLVSRYGGEFMNTNQREKARPLAEEAVAVARRLGDPATLAYTLNGLRLASANPDEFEEQTRLSTEALEHAIASGDREMILESTQFNLLDLRASEQNQAARAGVAEFARLAEELRQPFNLWRSLILQSSIASELGQFAEAERLSREALQVGLSAAPENAIQFHAAQLFLIRLNVGGMAEMREQLKATARNFAGAPGWRAVLASALAESGLLEEARREFEFFAREDFEPLPRDSIWMGCIQGLSNVCLHLGDLERAARLYEILKPYTGRCMASMLGIPLPMDEILGRLAAALGHYTEAERYFESVLAWVERTGVRPVAVRGRVQLASMLVQRSSPGDTARALELINEALPLAREMGMTPFLELALAQKLRIQGGDSSDTTRSIYDVASSVQSRRPDLAPVAADDGKVTLMFSDIEGFSQMTEALGDSAMHELMQVHNAIVRKEVAAQGGHEVELRGDGFLLAFAAPLSALRCAVALQRAFARHNEQQPDTALYVRIGLHSGEVIRDADKFFGKTVIQAFRVADLASGEEILVSEVVRESVEGEAEVRFGPPRSVELKGISGEHQLFSLEWNES